MANLGGFFAVSYLSEKVVRSALEDAWIVQWKAARGAMAYTVATPVGQLAARGAISADRPAVAFVGARNAIHLQLSVAARLDLHLDGVAAGGVFIEATPTADLPVVVEQDSVFNKGKVDLSRFTIDPGALRLTFYDAPPDGRSETAVLSDASRAQLVAEVRRRLQPFLTFSIPTDKVWAAETALLTAGGPGTIIVAPITKLGGARVLDGWLAIGIDDSSQTPTHGNPLQIGPPPVLPPGLASIHDSAAIIIDNGLLQAYLNLNAKFAILLGLATRPNIHPSGDPTVSVHDDVIEIRSVGSVDAPDPFPGTESYTATIKIKPFITEGGGWMYASVSPDISVDASWFLDVLGGLADFFGADVYAKLRRANRGSLAILFKTSIGADVPGMPGLRAGISARKVVLRSDIAGIYGSASTSTWTPAPPTEPKLIVEPLGSVHIRDRFLQLGFREIWAPLLLADPTYRLRYQIRRRSDGAVVLEGAGWSGAATFSEKLDMWDRSVYQETGYESEVILERPPGREIARRTDSIGVQDLFDRSHPFARWRHPTRWHSLNPPEAHDEVRLSSVHKTQITERCKFGDAGTARAQRYVVQALDQVPAPDDPEFSSLLCPYCFSSE